MASTLRKSLAAGGLATLGSLPVFLLGAQAVLMQEDLRFNEAELGIATGCFFGVAALTALVASGLVDRLSSRRATFIATSITAASALGIAFAAQSFQSLLAFLMLAGVGNAALQMTANVALARSVARGGQGLAYGVKQSAPAVAIMLGGLAVPAVGLVFGWRWTFGVVAVVCVLVAIATAGGRASSRGRPLVTLPGGESAPRAALMVAATATLLGSSAAVSLAAFLPNWAHQLGLSSAESGLLLSAGGAFALVVRLGAGLAADRRVGRHMPVVAGHLSVGAAGLMILSLEESPISVIVTGALIAFGIGWGWPGLLLFAVVRVGRERPGAAAGAMQGGNFAGAALGPMLFGYMASTVNYPAAWRAAAATMLLAAALLLVARRMFVTDMYRRPPGVAWD